MDTIHADSSYQKLPVVIENILTRLNEKTPSAEATPLSENRGPPQARLIRLWLIKPAIQLKLLLPMQKRQATT
jgi:hypothetical protein